MPSLGLNAVVQLFTRRRPNLELAATIMSAAFVLLSLPDHARAGTPLSLLRLLTFATVPHLDEGLPFPEQSVACNLEWPVDAGVPSTRDCLSRAVGRGHRRSRWPPRCRSLNEGLPFPEQPVPHHGVSVYKEFLAVMASAEHPLTLFSYQPSHVGMSNPV